MPNFIVIGLSTTELEICPREILGYMYILNLHAKFHCDRTVKNRVRNLSQGDFGLYVY